jgi:hypothetical protein
MPRAAPLVPVSWGELIDKLTILELKREKIHAPQAAGHVIRELEVLSAIVRDGPDEPRLTALTAELRTINARLWQVEDRLREKDACGEFDGEFITLARAVYQLNGERSERKRRINELLDSDLIEEKLYAAPGHPSAVR